MALLPAPGSSARSGLIIGLQLTDLLELRIGGGQQRGSPGREPGPRVVLDNNYSLKS